MKQPQHFFSILIFLAIFLLIITTVAQGTRLLYHNLPDYGARTFYALGHAQLDKQNSQNWVRHLWKIANYLYPLNGHIWVELASLEIYTYSNPKTAKKILAECIESETQFHGYPASQCQEALDRFEQIDPPGTLKSYVMRGL